MNTHLKQKEGSYDVALFRVLSFAGVKFVRYASQDPYGKLRCKAIPVDTLKKRGSFDYQIGFVKVVFGGLPTYGDVLQPASGFDASGTLLLRPDLSTLRILPYAPMSAMVFGRLDDQQSGKPSDFCCRDLLQRVLDKARADHTMEINVGAEVEFCLFDAKTDRPVDFSTFAETKTLNRQENYITDLYSMMAQQDIDIEMIHAESSPGQVELVLPYRDDPVSVVDHLILTQETAESLASSHGLKAIFLPKVSSEGAGSGCHFHFSFRDVKTGESLFPGTAGTDRNEFFDGSEDGISHLGQSFMEGILDHLPSLLALTLPTENSFRRVGPGCWTGHEAAWGFDDKEASIRVVSNHQKMIWEHFEYKLCDFHANLYLALACVISCGLDGIRNNLQLRPPHHRESGSNPLPTTLKESLDKLENDDVQLKVLGEHLLKAYVAVRRAEFERATCMTLEDELQEALQSA